MIWEPINLSSKATQNKKSNLFALKFKAGILFLKPRKV